MGKKKYIETPEKLWEIFEAYRKDVKDNPRYKVEYVGKEGIKVRTPIERPLSIDGFFTYGYDCGITIHHYFDNPEGAYDAYRGIITRIRKAVRGEQIDGGMTGFYNSNLTARINGLRDIKEVNAEVTQRPMFGDNPMKKDEG